MADTDPTHIDSRVHGHRPGALLRIGLQSATSTPLWTPPHVEELAPLFTAYRIERLLARGGMGAVYLAQQVALDRSVAVKILPAEMARNPEVVERFEREAKVLGRLSHPHIVPIFDFGQTATGLIYFVMEYVEGTSFDALIHPRDAQAERLAPDRALEIVAHVCDALAFAHTQGVVHRDLKPANVLIGRDGRARVADFGVARLTQGETQPGNTTMEGALLGTPDYMAPEQKLGQAVDHRADIYALGVVLYEALCGERPQGAFEMPSRLRKLPVKLDNVITRAIASKPEQRFQSAVEMKKAVVTVRPAVTRAQTAHSAPVVARRNRSLRTLGAIAATAALGCVITLPFVKKKPAPAVSQLHTPLSPPVVTPPKKTEGSPATATKEAPYANILGMKFVPVPITGGPTNGQRVLFSTWETRVQDYAAFVAETNRPVAKPNFAQGPTHPVVMIQWEGATAFCTWLTENERKSGHIGAHEAYRLPSDHEWSCAAGIGNVEDPAKSPAEKNNGIIRADWLPPQTPANLPGREVQPLREAGQFHWIEELMPNYEDPYIYTSPVGFFPPNQFGLYDLCGNAEELCNDWMRPNVRVLRGGDFCSSNMGQRQISSRIGARPVGTPRGLGGIGDGFRVVLAPVGLAAEAGAP